MEESKKGVDLREGESGKRSRTQKDLLCYVEELETLPVIGSN